MSKSLKRVIAALRAAGLDIRPVEARNPTRTAQEAADALGCAVDQIGKSIIFSATQTGKAILFLTAGGNRVDPARAGAVLGQPLGKADAALIRVQTGFAIGGVSPVGHLIQTPAFLDRRLLDFDVIWCAAGTPRHNFPIDPRLLIRKFNLQPADFAVSSQIM